MSDIIDRANRAAEQFTQRAIEAARGKTNGFTTLTHCEDCGEPIPEPRRIAVPGCRLCVVCQQERELLKHWRAT